MDKSTLRCVLGLPNNIYRHCLPGKELNLGPPALKARTLITRLRRLTNNTKQINSPLITKQTLKKLVFSHINNRQCKDRILQKSSRFKIIKILTF